MSEPLSASVQLQKEDKTYTDNVDAVIHNDGNNPSFHPNEYWMVMWPAPCLRWAIFKRLNRRVLS